MKKLTALLLTLVMVLSLCTFAVAEEKPVLTMWIPEDLRVEDWDTNMMTQWLEEQLGCELKFIVQPSTDYTTKVNMALTVGAIEDLPDVILGGDGTVSFSDSNVWEWAQAGTILCLNDYYNDPELAVNINLAKERTGVNYPAQITSPDGNLYAVATYNQSYGNEYVKKMWLYQPWLEKLGKEIPKTTDEFYELLKAVKEGDPNGNGKADELGLVGTSTFNNYFDGWFEFLMNAFVYAGDFQYRTVTDGKLGVAYTTEEWREGLRYIKKLMDEGLIPVENLTMSEEQFMAILNTEEAIVFSHVYAAPDKINTDLGRDVQNVGIPPLVGPKGVQYASYAPSVAYARMVITVNCKNPELAFKFGDLMSSRYIGISQRWGWEGINWDYPENVKNIDEFRPNVPGFDISIVAYSDNTFWGGTAISNSSWRQRGPYVREYAIANGTAVSLVKVDVLNNIWNEACIMYQNGGWNPSQVIPKLIFTSEEYDAIGEIEVNLHTYADESIGAFLTGVKDLDADWDAYLAELDRIGLNEYLKVAQEVYDRMY